MTDHIKPPHPVLGEGVETALLAAQARVGSAVPGNRNTQTELRSRGLTDKSGRLTVKGVSVRDAVARRREDEAFDD